MSWTLSDLEKTLLIGSTLVEGSTLTEKEARAVLAGRTISGHPIGEIRELLNYRGAVAWLMEEVARSPWLSVDLILVFHQRLFHGFPVKSGCWKVQPNHTLLTDGTRHDFLKPALVPKAMLEWTDRFNESDMQERKWSRSERVTKAVALYYAFQEIHPFEDGNGRIGRILIAYWLHWRGGLSFRFELKDKIPHLRALELANRGDLASLEAFFRQRLTPEKTKPETNSQRGKAK